MAKVIVERPRRGGLRRPGRTVDVEDMPSKESLRRPYRLRGTDKHLNENLAPLRRYLESRIGSRWDEVYSDIAAHLRVDSTVQQHVRDHLKDLVEIVPQERWFSVWDGAGGRRKVRGGRYQALYVDPSDGILKKDPDGEGRARAARRRAAERPIERIGLDAMRELRLIDGIWYEIAYASLPAPVYKTVVERRAVRLRPFGWNSPVVEMDVEVRRLVSSPVYDVALKRWIPLGPREDGEAERRRWRSEYGRLNGRYAVAKRQADGRTLRRHGIRNQG
jgi:hypothetical protein